MNERLKLILTVGLIAAFLYLVAFVFADPLCDPKISVGNWGACQ